jgi:hypothetical protein
LAQLLLFVVHEAPVKTYRKIGLAVTCWTVGMYVILSLLAFGFIGVNSDIALVIYGLVLLSMVCAFLVWSVPEVRELRRSGHLMRDQHGNIGQQ